MVAATVCCDAGPAEMPTVSLDPVASTPVPFSDQSGGTLVDDNIVCVTDSYQKQVRCGSTLATVVEREPDANGIGWREVDWYDIGRLRLGLPQGARISDSSSNEAR